MAQRLLQVTELCINSFVCLTGIFSIFFPQIPHCLENSSVLCLKKNYYKIYNNHINEVL